MNALEFSTLIFLLICAQIGRATDPLDTWTWRNPLPTGNTLNGIAYGNGQFVAVGVAGTIVTSADGVNWLLRQSGTQIVLNAIAYGNGHFVAVGDHGTILQSGSIITLSITPNVATGLLSLSLEGPTGRDYTIQTSTDLISWRNLTKITNAQPKNVILDAPAASDHVFYRAYSQ